MKFFGNDPPSRRIEMLKNIPVFHELTRKEILEVDELLHERAYEKDEIIFEQGDAGHGIFFILSGKVRAKSSRKLLEAATPEFGPGDMLGELSLFDEAPRNATAVAMERTLTVALFQAEFSSLLTKNKSIGVKVLVEISKTMSRRVRRLLLQETGLPSV
jgi:CRP/FNR family cyclic AMP-dependent transcriptional regulator